MKKSKLKNIVKKIIKEIKESRSIFGSFVEPDGKVNFNQLQAGIDNDSPEAIEIVKKLVSSPEHSKNITKTPMKHAELDSRPENMLKEGLISWFCCLGKGGCCFYEYSPGEIGYADSGGIMWRGCCNQGWPKKCCKGGIYNTWKTGGQISKPPEGFMPEQLKNKESDVEAVKNFTLTNMETGEVTRIDSSNSMYPKIKNQIANSKTLTKIRESNTVNEGKNTCCWAAGGCCKYKDVVKEEDFKYKIEYNACCYLRLFGNCCG